MKILNRFTGEMILEVETLRDANLRDADLSDADLSGANLRGADLSCADLRDADLRDADLRSADLRSTQGILVFQLDRHRVIAHPTQVQIGCERHSIEYWLENYKEIGMNNRYSQKQIEQYKRILDIVKTQFEGD